mmetsp:Transcript_39508/g.89098  ORF Transcript_39508/g.89098 Transcript_39508/m.89098 type:complete len:303 (+) Transcript_39508:987-1895(+)
MIQVLQGIHLQGLTATDEIILVIHAVLVVVLEEARYGLHVGPVPELRWRANVYHHLQLLHHVFKLAPGHEEVVCEPERLPDDRSRPEVEHHLRQEVGVQRREHEVKPQVVLVVDLGNKAAHERHREEEPKPHVVAREPVGLRLVNDHLEDREERHLVFWISELPHNRFERLAVAPVLHDLYLLLGCSAGIRGGHHFVGEAPACDHGEEKGREDDERREAKDPLFWIVGRLRVLRVGPVQQIENGQDRSETVPEALHRSLEKLHHTIAPPTVPRLWKGVVVRVVCINIPLFVHDHPPHLEDSY